MTDRQKLIEIFNIINKSSGSDRQKLSEIDTLIFNYFKSEDVIKQCSCSRWILASEIDEVGLCKNCVRNKVIKERILDKNESVKNLKYKYLEYS